MEFEVGVPVGRPGRKQQDLAAGFLHQHALKGRAAGAEVIETNTFGANPVKLSSYGLGDRTEEVNKAAVQLARRAAQGSIHHVDPPVIDEGPQRVGRRGFLGGLVRGLCRRFLRGFSSGRILRLSCIHGDASSGSYPKLGRSQRSASAIEILFRLT